MPRKDNMLEVELPINLDLNKTLPVIRKSTENPQVVIVLVSNEKIAQAIVEAINYEKGVQ
jgi:hypothetical protein